jgi:hypothetical protein
MVEKAKISIGSFIKTIFLPIAGAASIIISVFVWVYGFGAKNERKNNDSIVIVSDIKTIKDNQETTNTKLNIMGIKLDSVVRRQARFIVKLDNNTVVQSKFRLTLETYFKDNKLVTKEDFAKYIEMMQNTELKKNLDYNIYPIPLQNIYLTPCPLGLK